MISSVNSNSEQTKMNHFQKGILFQVEFVWQRMTPYFVTWKLLSVVCNSPGPGPVTSTMCSHWVTPEEAADRRQKVPFSGYRCDKRATEPGNATTCICWAVHPALLRALIGPALKMVGEKFCFPGWEYCSDRGGSGIIVDSDILDQSSFKLITYSQVFTEHCRRQRYFVDLGFPY